MNKKVLVISSSPRRGGNSDLLCDQFVRGAEEAGHQVEKICLRSLKIGFCSGCEACLEKGRCVIADDAPAVCEKMVDADVIVFATPVYFYSMSAQLKALIDRTVGCYTQMKGKEVYFILTAADTDKGNLQPVLAALRGFTEGCLEGTVEKGIVYGVGCWHQGTVKDTPAMDEARQMGRRV